MKSIPFFLSNENYSGTVATIYAIAPLAKNKGGRRCRR